MRNLYLVFLLVPLALSGCGGASNANSNSVVTSQVASDNSNSSGRPAASPQTVTIAASDGLEIVGTYLDSGKPNSPALLLLHQWQSDRHSYDEFAKREQARGFNVLAIDGRGFGESTKKADGGNVLAERTDEAVKKMLGDVGAAVDFLKSQNHVDPDRIAIVGASYGSSLAIIYAADHPKMAAIGLLSPGLNYFGNMQTEPAINNYGDRPLLMFAAEDDKDSADAVRQLASSGNNPKYQQHIFESGGHGTALLKAGAADELERFFAEALRPN